jgi:cytoskeleton protein RodZ
MTSSAAQQIGQQLRDARVERGLSLHDVADRLKLSLRQLEWMEAGDFARLPGATFVRGFVRNYARFLELDSAPLMALLEQEYPSSPVDRAPPPQAAEAQSAMGSKLWWLLLPALVVAALIAWQQQDGSTETAAPQGELVPMLHQAASDALASAPQSEPASTPVAVVVAPVASAVAMASPASAATAVPAPVASKPASAPVAQAGQKAVRVQAGADSWVSVVDASGKKLVYGLIRAGQSQEVRGVPPFKLKIGNAPQVVLSYDGAVIDLKDKTRGATAKLELN